MLCDVILKGNSRKRLVFNPNEIVKGKTSKLSIFCLSQVMIFVMPFFSTTGGGLCIHKDPECDKETSVCRDLDGIAVCQCKPGYFKYNKLDHSCRGIVSSTAGLRRFFNLFGSSSKDFLQINVVPCISLHAKELSSLHKY